MSRVGRDLRRELVREDRRERRGRGRLPRAALREPRRARGRPGDVHADAQSAGRDRVRLHRHAARRRTASASSPEPRSASTTSRGSGSTRPDDGSVQVDRRDLAVRVLRHLGAEGARDPAAADDGRSLERGVPVHACARARDRSRAVPRAARDVRRRARAGSSTALPSSGSRSGTRSGRPDASTASSPAATRRSTRCGSRRATASGARTSRPRTRRSRRGSASRSSSTRATSSAATRSRRRASPSGCSAASRSTIRARSRSAPSRCGSGGELVGRVTSGGYGYTVERSIAYAYLPAEHDVGTRGRGRDLRRVGRGRDRRGAALRPGGRADPRVSDARGRGRARLAGPRRALRGARRRDHEPQPQGRGRRRARSCCASPGKDTEPARHRPHGRARGDEARGRARHRAGGRRVRRARRAGSSRASSTARSLRSSGCASPAMLARVAAALRAFHDGPPIPGSLRLVPRRRDVPRDGARRGAASVPDAYEWAHEIAGADRGAASRATRPCPVTTTS